MIQYKDYFSYCNSDNSGDDCALIVTLFDDDYGEINDGVSDQYFIWETCQIREDKRDFLTGGYGQKTIVSGTVIHSVLYRDF